MAASTVPADMFPQWTQRVVTVLVDETLSVSPESVSSSQIPSSPALSRQPIGRATTRSIAGYSGTSSRKNDLKAARRLSAPSKGAKRPSHWQR